MTNSAQPQITTLDAASHIVENDGHEAAIFVEIENGFRKGEPGKLTYLIFHLKVVSTLGCYAGTVAAENHESWQEVFGRLSPEETADLLGQNDGASRHVARKEAFIETLWTPFCEAMQPAKELAPSPM